MSDFINILGPVCQYGTHHSHIGARCFERSNGCLYLLVNGLFSGVAWCQYHAPHDMCQHTRRTGSVFCVVHACSVQGCHNFKHAGNFCHLHICRGHACQNQKDDGKNGCAGCCCTIDGCGELAHYSTFCPRHFITHGIAYCKIFKCRNYHMDGVLVCAQHVDVLWCIKCGTDCQRVGLMSVSFCDADGNRLTGHYCLKCLGFSMHCTHLRPDGRLCGKPADWINVDGTVGCHRHHDKRSTRHVNL